MTIPDTLAAANVILAAIICWKSAAVWLRVRSLAWAWIKFAQILVGVIWVAISLYLLITPEDAAQAEIGRIIARPAITMTLAIMAAGSIVGDKR